MPQVKRFLVPGLGVLTLIFCGVIIYGGLRLRSTAQQLTEKTASYTEVAQRRDEALQEIATLSNQVMQLEDSLRTELKKNEYFDKQLKKLSGTVGTLQKLQVTDPELLQKYSQVYFLNEHYTPSQLRDIPESYVSKGAVRTPLSFHGDALPYLESMLDAAQEDGIDLRVISAYRSFGTQSQLKSSYVRRYGSGANTFSADQGYSEHQLGTTVDLTTSQLGSSFSTFGDTEAYTWLVEQGYRYGFVLSYPAGNAYYQFEPWHWRFVGRDLARDLYRDKRSLYDVDQRTLDGYLVSIFD